MSDADALRGRTQECPNCGQPAWFDVDVSGPNEPIADAAIICEHCDEDVSDQLDDGPKAGGDYPPEFYAVRDDVLDRDGHCVICGSEDDLHVHHVDRDKSNNDPSNLVTLCQRDHMRVHYSGELLLEIQAETHPWRVEKIPDLNPRDQLDGTMVEVAEILEAVVKEETYDEGWADDEHVKEEIGDVIIYLSGFCALKGFDMTECIHRAQAKNSERDWDEHMRAGR